VAITPVAVEVWVSSWWNDWGHVGSGCGSRALIDCARSRPSHRWKGVPWLGGPWLPVLPEGSTCPSGEAEVREGVERFDDIMGAWVRQKLPPEAPMSPETFPHGSGGVEVDFRASSG
jgi:hypothetical protein